MAEEIFEAKDGFEVKSLSRFVDEERKIEWQKTRESIRVMKVMVLGSILRVRSSLSNSTNSIASNLVKMFTRFI